MSHHIYHTEAIILGARPSGEGDRLLYCYTRELGLVVAHARSIREARSRLRYALQLFSHAQIDLIRGKYGWKLISATPISSFRELWSHAGRRRVAAEHLRLARRLIQGEEQHEVLFDDFLNGLTLISTLFDRESLKDAELLLVVRLLDALGYWGEQKELSLAFAGCTFTEDDLAKIRPHRSAIVAGVNRALDSTQL
ncbi:MAG: repair protein RecO protein [Parcubacteria group bacterium GW2011_GWA2_47_7]|nr:MAG: repair protein RecO protein [Parcubacteria group bacterium GW2011_GWA2_47_7]